MLNSSTHPRAVTRRYVAAHAGMDSIVPDAIVSVRLANRGTITGEFDADATLADVLAWIQVSRTDGPGSFSLETSYPRAVLQLQDKDRTLASCPRPHIRGMRWHLDWLSRCQEGPVCGA